MITPKTLTPRTVVLAASVWRAEIASELLRLGLTPAAAADAGALDVLRRVLARHGWPGDVYEVASPSAALDRFGQE